MTNYIAVKDLQKGDNLISHHGCVTIDKVTSKTITIVYQDFYNDDFNAKKHKTFHRPEELVGKAITRDNKVYTVVTDNLDSATTNAILGKLLVDGIIISKEQLLAIHAVIQKHLV